MQMLLFFFSLRWYHDWFAVFVTVIFLEFIMSLQHEINHYISNQTLWKCAPFFSPSPLNRSALSQARLWFELQHIVSPKEGALWLYHTDDAQAESYTQMHIRSIRSKHDRENKKVWIPESASNNLLYPTKGRPAALWTRCFQNKNQ